MDLLVHRPSAVEYSEDTAHTIEVIREEDESGEFGSFGFTLLYEKPPIVGTIVPGTGPRGGGVTGGRSGTSCVCLCGEFILGCFSQTVLTGELMIVKCGKPCALGYIAAIG